MNKKLIEEELERIGVLLNLISDRKMGFYSNGLRIDVQVSAGTWEIMFTATVEETTVAGESVKATLTTLRDGLQTQLYTLDEMIAKYDEVNE